MEMAKRFPDAHVVAIDIGNDHPRTAGIDYHVEFRSAVDFTGNIWGLEEGSFDFIHVGMICGSIPDWPRFWSRVYRSVQASDYV